MSATAAASAWSNNLQGCVPDFRHGGGHLKSYPVGADASSLGCARFRGPAMAGSSQNCTPGEMATRVVCETLLGQIASGELLGLHPQCRCERGVVTVTACRHDRIAVLEVVAGDRRQCRRRGQVDLRGRRRLDGFHERPVPGHQPGGQATPCRVGAIEARVRHAGVQRVGGDARATPSAGPARRRREGWRLRLACTPAVGRSRGSPSRLSKSMPAGGAMPIQPARYHDDPSRGAARNCSSR